MEAHSRPHLFSHDPMLARHGGCGAVSEASRIDVADGIRRNRPGRGNLTAAVVKVIVHKRPGRAAVGAFQHRPVSRRSLAGGEVTGRIYVPESVERQGVHGTVGVARYL